MERQAMQIHLDHGIACIRKRSLRLSATRRATAKLHIAFASRINCRYKHFRLMRIPRDCFEGSIRQLLEALMPRQR
jgi:hypothetical protein